MPFGIWGEIFSGRVEWWLRNETLCHHNLEEYPDEYIEDVQIAAIRKAVTKGTDEPNWRRPHGEALRRLREGNGPLPSKKPQAEEKL
jgi:hypothetical protein